MHKLVVFSLSIILIFQIATTKVDAKQEIETPNLLSESAILIDAKTGQILYEKNAKQDMYPASLTKIATAIYAIDQGNLDELVTVSDNAYHTGGSSVYLREGEQLQLKALLQGLLVNSGNDAGVAIAEHLDGSVEKFSYNINRYIKNTIGVQDTNFLNPHGLFDSRHTTTAFDLAKITQYSIQNQTFKDMFGIKKLEWNGPSWNTTLYTHHKLMRETPYGGVTGGKTGYVSESGFTLVTTAERENISLIAVVLKASQANAYSDTTKLLDYGFTNFETGNIAKGKQYMNDTGITYEAPEDLYFTKSIGEEIEPKLLNNGELVINQQQSRLNIIFELKRKIEEVEKNQQQLIVENNADKSEAGNNMLNLIIRLFQSIFKN